MKRFSKIGVEKGSGALLVKGSPWSDPSVVKTGGQDILRPSGVSVRVPSERESGNMLKKEFQKWTQF